MEKKETRLYNLDILKALAIIAMVICHPVERLGTYIPGYEDDFWFIFDEDFLGSYFFVAHAFMMALGIEMIYSEKQ